jgi:hypothetical protein
MIKVYHSFLKLTVVHMHVHTCKDTYCPRYKGYNFSAVAIFYLSTLSHLFTLVDLLCFWDVKNKTESATVN